MRRGPTESGVARQVGLVDDASQPERRDPDQAAEVGEGRDARDLLEITLEVGREIPIEAARTVLGP
jgi:hypothetical protein